MSKTLDYWNAPMPEVAARRVLGPAHFAFVVGKGAAVCDRLARDAWNCNDESKYGAYRAAKRVALLGSDAEKEVVTA